MKNSRKNSRLPEKRTKNFNIGYWFGIAITNQHNKGYFSAIQMLKTKAR